VATAAPPLEPAAVAALVRASLEAIRAEVAALSEPLLVWHPAPGEWSVKEVIGHLIEADRRGFSGRIRIVLDGTDPALERWDQNAVARARGDDANDARLLLEELTGLREDGVALARRLRPADLGRGGHHPAVGYLTVSDLLHEWVHHDRNHLKQILANVQAYAWPHMGNSQRFSSE
jgi:hypothetical protein